MKKTKIPTILGILILIIGVGVGVYLVQSKQIFRLRASPETTPKDIRITNISDSSIAVSWTTAKEVQGFIKWGENSTALDKTATTTINTNSNIHSVSLHGLAPSTTYFFQINSDSTDYDNEGIPWQAITGPTLTVPPKSIVISGLILAPSGTPAANVLVYASVGGSSMLSSTTNSNGLWVIPISSARTQNLDSYININETSTLVEISVQGGALGVASAQIYPSSAKPSPDITLGEIHDFKNLPPSKTTDIPDAEIDLPDNATKSSGFQISDDAKVSDTVTLESFNEGELVTTNEPEFFGEGPPGTELTITVESNPQTESVEVEQSGFWSWSPPEGLEEGIHKVTISWLNTDGILQTLTRSFIVNAEEGPAFVATPSATPTSTTTPTPTSTLAPTPSPTAIVTGTITITPTQTPTTTPTATLTPRPTKTATDSGLPDAGTSTPTILLAILGAGSLIFGTLLFFTPAEERKRL